MYIVTGGAGFIGSNLVRALNERGITDILVVDNLKNGKKFVNLVDCKIADYMDKQQFLQQVENREIPYNIDCIFHMGACSATTEWDGHYMMLNNYEYSKTLFHYAQLKAIPFLYASSAAVYGANNVFIEEEQYESPLNVYGYSKLLFDNYVRRIQTSNQVAGFRFFNVYGPREQHKGSMASVAYHHNEQLKHDNVVKLFGANDGYGPGEQVRDFIYVGDVVDVLLWFMENPSISGVFNVGTGRAQPFNDVASAVISHHQRGSIEYIDFPEHLKNSYQSFTQADISRLRAAGYNGTFKSVEEGIAEYLDIINGA